MNHLRSRLVEAALEWERAFGNAPSITSALSEFDAARLVGSSIEDYSVSMQGKTAVQKGHDFVKGGIRYQVKGNRPSGKPRSHVTLVSKAKNYEWDRLVWVLYDRKYQIEEAWDWTRADYVKAFHDKKRLSPNDMRLGRRLELT